MGELQRNHHDALVPSFYDGQFSELDLSNSTRADHLFESTRAAEWIEEARIETDGRLDMQVTADNLGIPLIMGAAVIDGKEIFAADGCITGLGDQTGQPVAIYVMPDMSPEKQSLTFGHEVGHFFLEKVAGIWIHKGGKNPDIEDFCEFFGREMVINHSKLESIDPVNQATITELMAQYGADHQTVIFQLMLAGRLPTRVILDSEIGEVPNPFYSGKVGRKIVCIECELGMPHTNYQEGDGTLLLDFRGYEWDGITSLNNCNARHEIKNHIAINKHYGRWTPKDDVLIEGETRRRNELVVASELHKNNSLDPDSDEDLPF